MTKDFSHQNLRGRSFKNQNLVGANFSGADIRSCNFSGANLTGANFSGVQAGLEPHWKCLWIVISFLTAILWGVVSQRNNAVTAIMLSFYIQDSFGILASLITGLTVLVILSFFFTITRYYGLTFSLAIVSAIVSITVFPFLIDQHIKNTLGTVGTALIGTVVISLLLSIILTLAGVVAGRKLIFTVFILALFVIIAPFFNTVWTLTMPFINMVDDMGVNNFLAFVLENIQFENGSNPILGSIFVALIGGIISWRALLKDENFNSILKIALFFATMGGTNFRRANLTDANFTQATLKSTNFTGAVVTRTIWLNAKKLFLARVGKIIWLNNSQIRQLLVTGQGQNQNFDYQNLRTVNLQGANLADASFIGADLSHANLQDADLTRAKLVQTQLDGTDFTGATLTGAYIEDWNITTDTKFDGVRCEYVYMRLPTLDNPDPHRKPDNRQEVFADGEFGDFIKPIFDTLDLYHSQGVDPRAIAISFKQLAENHPEADLRIVGMEVRGEDKFLLRAKTAIAGDKSQLSAEYFETYNKLKALPKEDLIFLLAQQDGQIQSLEVAFKTVNQGLIAVSETPKRVVNNYLQQAQIAGGLVNADTVNANQIGGNITNYNPEQKQNLAQAAAEIQQLLNQLSQTYPTTTTSQKMTVVAKAVDEIERNPTLKARVIGALKAGGTEALKELIDNPLINILLASIDGWQDAE
ncbi:pentapeptide repeat-containing protein [Anabaena azotica]|uniref:Pentapeptide repeat-containing protein n=1 Tax=Anabaena azotica FACHB-119 TaxID=947527 RepID=A0ABR8DGI7_9NOST|nr:pentapeptide repeat-containing protein [Anabaena azotica]MBD2504863.1 pentapeptide repeat-containing protein [Anabaena azotica FACHB-119]